MASQVKQLLLLCAAAALAAVAIADLEYITVQRDDPTDIYHPKIVITDTKDGDPKLAESGDIHEIGSSARFGVNYGKWVKVIIGDKVVDTRQVVRDKNLVIAKNGKFGFGDTYKEAFAKAFKASP